MPVLYVVEVSADAACKAFRHVCCPHSSSSSSGRPCANSALAYPRLLLKAICWRRDAQQRSDVRQLLSWRRQRRLSAADAGRSAVLRLNGEPLATCRWRHSREHAQFRYERPTHLPGGSAHPYARRGPTSKLVSVVKGTTGRFPVCAQVRHVQAQKQRAYWHMGTARRHCVQSRCITLGCRKQPML